MVIVQAKAAKSTISAQNAKGMQSPHDFIFPAFSLCRELKNIVRLLQISSHCLGNATQLHYRKTWRDIKSVKTMNPEIEVNQKSLLPTKLIGKKSPAV